MTEQEWLECRDPAPVLSFLGERASKHQCRYFIAACCRRIWHLLPEASRRAVEVGERYAGGRATYAELREAAEGALTPDAPAEAAALAAVASAWTHHRTAIEAAACAARAVARAADPENEDDPDPAEQAEQCRLLREVFGNPFRPVALDAAWLTWNDAVVPRVAQGIHERRSFEELPVLADALTEAGCGEESILAHCRQPGGHVPGCWVVEALRQAAPGLPPSPDPAGELRQALTDAVITSSKRPLENLKGLLEQVQERRRKEAEAFAGKLAWGILIFVAAVSLYLLLAR
jgi:hypothetical protein